MPKSYAGDAARSIPEVGAALVDQVLEVDAAECHAAAPGADSGCGFAGAVAVEGGVRRDHAGDHLAAAGDGHLLASFDPVEQLAEPGFRLEGADFPHRGPLANSLV
jgi:hypothetical protein